MIIENRRKPLATITLDASSQNITNAFANLGGTVALVNESGNPEFGIADGFEVISPSNVPIQLQLVKAAAPQPTHTIPCGFALGREAVGVPVATGDQFKIKSLGANITSGVFVINIFRTI